jgi:anaerobic selenocysteine-containing dehydrogenase
MGRPLGYAAAIDVTRDLLADIQAYATAADGVIPSDGMLVREFSAEQSSPTPALTSGEISGPPPGLAAASQAPGETLVLLTWSELVGHETMAGQTAELMETVPGPYVEVNRSDAARLGVVSGQEVEVTSARGSVRREARVNTRCPEGVCFAPDNLGHPRINAVLDWEQPHTLVRISAVRAEHVAAELDATGARDDAIAGVPGGGA